MSDRLDLVADALMAIAVICAAVWFVRHGLPFLYRLAGWMLS